MSFLSYFNHANTHRTTIKEPATTLFTTRSSINKEKRKVGNRILEP